MYFLHSDSINALNLKPASDGTPKKDYCTGEVEDKEYCHAKKVCIFKCTFCLY